MGSDPEKPLGVRPLQVFAWFTAAAGFLLIIAGGLVTSTGSGLAVPDWPLSYGSLFPPMVGGIRYEHTHRLVAAGVGLLTLLLTLAILAAEKRRWVRRLALAAFAAVVLQGILGGLTVLLLLPAPISIAHATLGQTFFALLAVLATVLGPGWNTLWGQTLQGLTPEGLTPRRVPWGLFLSMTALVYLQLLLGAALRHLGWSAPLLAAHGTGAILAGAVLLRAAFVCLRDYSDRPEYVGPARILLLLVPLQILLGLLTFLQGSNPFTATGHVAVGALLLATSAVLTTHSLRAALAPLPGSAPLSRRQSGGARLADLLELTKPRLTILSVLTVLLGFLMGQVGPFPWGRFIATLIGTTLVGAAAAALNQAMEWQADSRMSRTRTRPIPSGRVSPEAGLAVGVTLSIAGLATLSFGVHLLAAALAALTLVTYLFIYTPLKSRSALCTLLGAVPGALPPMIGWAAARGMLGLPAWWLFSILFLWQLPHFLALAWQFRSDYRQAGFRMLPVLDPEGGLTFRQVVLYLAALLPVSLLPVGLGFAGWLYFSVALAGGVIFLGLGLATARARSGQTAHRLFLASVVYLPVLLTTLTLDRVIS